MLQECRVFRPGRGAREEVVQGWRGVRGQIGGVQDRAKRGDAVQGARAARKHLGVGDDRFHFGQRRTALARSRNSVGRRVSASGTGRSTGSRPAASRPKRPTAPRGRAEAPAMTRSPRCTPACSSASGTGGLLEELACGKRLRSIGHDQRQRGTIALLRDHVARPQNKGGWGRLWCDERLNARLRSGFFTHDTFLRRRVGDAGRRHYTGFFRAG